MLPGFHHVSALKLHHQVLDFLDPVPGAHQSGVRGSHYDGPCQANGGHQAVLRIDQRILAAPVQGPAQKDVPRSSLGQRSCKASQVPTSFQPMVTGTTRHVVGLLQIAAVQGDDGQTLIDLIFSN